MLRDTAFTQGLMESLETFNVDGPTLFWATQQAVNTVALSADANLEGRELAVQAYRFIQRFEQLLKSDFDSSHNTLLRIIGLV
eukprot:COSAG06_NODE_13709_length_1228_cov_0.968113_2_plen_82_part_01